MNWYKKAQLDKFASMDVMVADFDYPIPKKNISDLGYYIQNYILYKTDFQQQLTDFEKAYWMKNKSPEFITMDGLGVDDEKGTINVYLAGLPERVYPVLQSYLNKMLQEEGFKFNIGGIEDSKMFKSKVMRVNILDNPHSREAVDGPPDLNMANDNAKLIFEKVLNYDLSDYSLEIPAFDIINRINKVTEENITKNEIPWSRDWGKGQAEVIHNGLYSDQIKFRLNRIKEIAQWAINHGYKRISVA